MNDLDEANEEKKNDDDDVAAVVVVVVVVVSVEIVYTKLAWYECPVQAASHPIHSREMIA
jgi:hypothetical protein